MAEKIVLKNFEDIERKVPSEFLAGPSWRQEFEMIVRRKGFGAMIADGGGDYPGTYLRAMKANAERKCQNISEYLFDILIRHVTESVPGDIKKAYGVASLSGQDEDFFKSELKHVDLEYPFVDFEGWCCDSNENKDLEIVVEE